MREDNASVADERWIKTYRWFFFLSLAEIILFFVVPAFGFPVEYVPYVLAIAALTLGLLVAVFFLMVNLCGIVIDRSRRWLHLTMIAFLTMWLLWAVVTWSYIEHMGYLLG